MEGDDRFFELGTTEAGVEIGERLLEVADQIHPQRERERGCGKCSACCGIILKVPNLQDDEAGHCRHLAKAGRCGVYAQRPALCAGFRCMWLLGFFDREWRPDRVGWTATLSLTDGEERESSIAFSVLVTTGDLESVSAAAAQTLANGWCVELQFTNYKRGRVTVKPHEKPIVHQVSLSATIQAMRVEQKRRQAGAPQGEWWQDIPEASRRLAEALTARPARQEDEADVLNRRTKLVIER